MWIRQIAMGLIGLSAGVVVAGGLFGFIVGLGVISDFADRTHTANRIFLYEDAVALGGIVGNLLYTYRIEFPSLQWLLGPFGFLAGAFVGCWAIALTEILNVFPIFSRRMRITKGLQFIILGIALGKGIGAWIYFFNGWLKG